jgi:hypothetical protein
MNCACSKKKKLVSVKRYCTSTVGCCSQQREAKDLTHTNQNFWLHSFSSPTFDTKLTEEKCSYRDWMGRDCNQDLTWKTREGGQRTGKRRLDSGFRIRSETLLQSTPRSELETDVNTTALKSFIRPFLVCNSMLRCCKYFCELTQNRFHAIVRNECEHVLAWHACTPYTHTHTHTHTLFGVITM